MKHLLWIAAPWLLAAGCSSESGNRLPAAAEAALRGAANMELLALDPTPLSEGATATAGGDFHGYPIRGRAPAPDADARRELAELVLRGIRESDGKVAACFNPRHGVRVQQDGHVLELVICFECLSLEAHGDLLGPGVTRASALTSRAVEPAVTKLFERAGLRIAAD